MRSSTIVRLLSVSSLLALIPSAALAANHYTADNLVSDDAGDYPAPVIDPSLVNPWGISYGPTGPFWISDNATGVSTVYSVNPVTQATAKLGLTVTIPGEGSVTGQVFAGSPGNFNGDAFLFANEDGTISGWRGALGTNAENLVLPSSANYKGLALITSGSDAYVLGANFTSGAIDVYKGNAGAPDLAGNFVDPALPAGYAPFNVQRLGGSIYVTYAVQGDGGDEAAGAGLGIVDRFGLDGSFGGRLVTGGSLNAPWGLALAPTSYGALAGALLVGNFGDGQIHAYDAMLGTALGTIMGADNQPLSIEGLWALTVGNDGLAGSSQSVYFTAGPDEESHGIFGVLSPAAVPEPTSWAMMIAGLGLAGGLARSSGRYRRISFG